jgi:hypothetical protein
LIGASPGVLVEAADVHHEHPGLPGDVGAHVRPHRALAQAAPLRALPEHRQTDLTRVPPPRPARRPPPRISAGRMT